jgi:hypothetical protein
MPNLTTNKHYDVFNGDADGLCALHQLRMAEPCPAAQLITGVKRDIRLLDRLLGTENAEITVLDISLDSNRQPLEKLLNHNLVHYIDHHFAGQLPESANLVAHLDPDPETCTALIVDHLLDGRFRNWAITGAFGDNLHKSAYQAAAGTGLVSRELEILKELGELLNYNGYGKTVADLYFHPADLYNAMKSFHDPLDFWLSAPELTILRQGFNDDMGKARQCEPVRTSGAGRVYLFPAEPWCRRVAGVFSNEKAREREGLAHALLIDNGDQTTMASIRAPLTNRTGADELCRSFPTGGGRPAAAGINALPDEMLDEFLTAFEEVFG